MNGFSRTGLGAGAILGVLLLSATALAEPDAAMKTNLAWQIALDRVGFSGGILDGKVGPKGKLATREFQRAKGHVKGSLVLSLEDPGSRMSRLGKSEISHGDFLTVGQSLRRIEAVTLDDARRVAERVLSQPMTLTVLGPFAKNAFAESSA